MPYFPPFSFNQPVDPYGIDYSQIQDPYDISELQRWARTPLPQVLAAEQTAPMSFDQRFNQLYQPQTQVTDEYTRLANQFPIRQKPGKLDRIAAAFIEAGTARPSAVVGGQPIGFEMAPARERIAAREAALYPNYHRELEDWTTRLKGLEPAMTAERYYNINARQTAAEIARREQEQQKIDLQAKKQQDINEYYSQKLALERLKLEKPNLKFHKQEGGNILVENPATGEITDSGVKSDVFTKAEEIRLGITSREKIASAQIASRERIAQERDDDIIATFQETVDGKVKTFGVTRGGQKKEISTTGVITRPGTPPRGSTSATETPTQRKVREYNRAREAHNTHPEWQKWIKLGDPGTNDFKIEEPPSYWFKQVTPAEKKSYEDMVKFIYNTSGVPDVPSQNIPGGLSREALGLPATSIPDTAPMIPSPAPSVSPELQQKARDFLIQNKLPVTPRNIDHAIKTGRVK